LRLIICGAEMVESVTRVSVRSGGGAARCLGRQCSGARRPALAVRNVAGHLALVGAPIAAEAAGGVAGSGLSGARSAGSAFDLRSKRIALRFEVADAAEEVRFIALGKARSLRDDVGPQASADAERRQEPQAGAPGGLGPPRAQDHPERSSFKTRERQRDDESVQEDGDGDPDRGQAAMAPADDSASDVDLGEPDEDGERRGARPEECRAGLGSDRLAIGSDDDETEPRYEGKDGKEGDPATWTVHECPFRRGADREGIFSAVHRQEAREGLFAGGSSTVSLTCRVGGGASGIAAESPEPGRRGDWSGEPDPGAVGGTPPAAPESKMVSSSPAR
jgi:hypothetical protein